MTAATSEDVSWPELHRVRRAIVVVDVVESVRLMQANEADVIDRWRRFVAEVRTQVLPKHGGRMVKSLGDGMLLEFETVPTAVAAAFDIQRTVARYNDGYEPDAQIWLRAGGHVGDVTEDELDVYGPAVNLAARIATLAGPGQIAVSVEARDELASDVDAVLEDLGNCYFKHLVEPVRCFLVRPPSALLAMAPPIPAADKRRSTPALPSCRLNAVAWGQRTRSRVN